MSDTLETGKSLTLGLDYKKQDKNDLNKSFEVKLATMFRDKEEKFIPANSTLGKKILTYLELYLIILMNL